MAFIKIRGVLPPVITPFTESGKVDGEAFMKNLERWNETGLAGYLVLGSSSEAVFLNETEKLELIRITADTAKEGMLIMAGTGMESTRETIAPRNKAADAGAQYALILAPGYYGAQMGDEAQIRCFTDVADNVDIPILISNVTKFTNINISPRAVGILSEHPNVIGMKDSSGNIPQLIQFRQAADLSEFNLMVGTASAWYPAMDLGTEAAIMALANLMPKECVRIQELFDEGRHEEAKSLYEKIFPVNPAVTATYGVPGLKFACSEAGYRGGSLRRPLPDLKDDERAAIRRILKDAGAPDAWKDPQGAEGNAIC